MAKRKQHDPNCTAPNHDHVRCIVKVQPPENFDGWVMVAQYERGVLLQTDIEALPDTDSANCDTAHEVQRRAVYQLTSPEDAQVLCQVCVQDLVDGAGTMANGGCYVIGALPAN